MSGREYAAVVRLYRAEACTGEVISCTGVEADWTWRALRSALTAPWPEIGGCSRRGVTRSILGFWLPQGVL
jgi:hypothetical protein